MNVNAVKHQAKRSENSDSHRIKARGKSATVWTLSISVSSAVSAPCAPQTQFIEPSSNVIIAEPVTQPETVPVAGSVASSAQNCPQETPVVADKLGISLLLVHHLRKQGDSDPLNKLSGSTGISGAVDAVFVLERSKRNSDSAALICTGRDIPYRELELRFEKETCTWSLIADSVEQPELLLPQEISAVAAYMADAKSFSGSNTEFAQRVGAFSSLEISAKGLKQMMNRYRYELDNLGVRFQSTRSNGQRFLSVTYRDASDVSDAENTAAKTCVPCGTCVPATLA